jgi:dienelactone hydrolase
VSAVEGFAETAFEHGGTVRPVYRAGVGPAVVVISEIPGITPKVAGFARRVADLGCTVAMPSLFGTPGREPSPGAIARSLGSACVSREFVCLATGRTSPVTVWLRALARSLHEECGGPGVGVVGMCLTGGFALAMMVDDAVVAPVLSQPSLPFPVSRRARRDLGVAPDDLAAARRRVHDEGVCVLALRFTGDRAVPSDRFVRLREEFGPGVVTVEIDSSPGNPHGIPRSAHSVLTEHLVDEPGHPTRDALEQVLELFRSRLLVAPPR